MAEKHGVKVVLDRLEGVEGYVIDRTIVLEEELYPPRRNWRFCHELAHILLKHQEQNRISREMEFEADALASKLILPEKQFRESMQTLDIPELKEKYHHASWEVILRRWAKERQAVLTIYDNGCLTRRIGPDKLAYPLRPLPPEVEIAEECWKMKEHLSRQVGSEITLHLRAFFVDEGRGVERVLLLTEPQI